MDWTDRPEDEIVRSAALEILEDGPLTTERLVDALALGGFLDHLVGLHPDDRLDEVAFALEDTDAFYEVGDWVASTKQLLDGITLTHVVTQAELDHGIVTLTPDLGAIDLDGIGGLRLPGGGTTDVVFDSEVPSADGNGSLVGPQGWLVDLPPGLTAFHRRGDELTLEAHPDVTDGAVESAALQSAIDEFAVRGIGFEADEAIAWALTADQSLFRRPTRPLGTLLAELGFESRGAWFGPADDAWETPGERYLEQLAEEVARHWGFDRCCAEAFAIVRGAWTASFGSDPLDQSARRSASRALLHESVSEAFVDFVLQEFDRGSEPLASFATQLLDQPPSARAPAHYLLAMNCERDRETGAAEAHLAEAVLLDPEYGAALGEYAWYVADRGDAVRASSLLQRAGAGPDDPGYAYLAEQATRSQAVTAKVGRNDPCPCGSGKRYKQCCINGHTAAIELRAGWLTQKLDQFAVRPMRRRRITELLEVFDEFEVEPAEHMMSVLVDLVAWEPDTMQEFIDSRGYLLPQDELRLLHEWKTVPLELYEVVGADPGATLTVRDTRDGAQIVVTERTASRNLKPNSYLLTRIARAGTQHQIVGVVLPVTLSQRPSVLELLDGGYESEDVVAWLAWLSRPPTVTNREGHDLTLCTLTLRPIGVGWDVAVGALNAEFGPAEEGAWTDCVDIDGERVVRAVLRRDGSDLVVETNSLERSEDVAERLMDLGSIRFEVIDSVETTLDELDSPLASDPVAEGSAWFPDDDTSDVPDGIRRAMDELMVEQERKWIDESVPALGGLSPREAALDPTRREDLLALLSEFDRRTTGDASIGTFNVDRIRGLLGL